ncbi:MAG: UbiA family prenyltransferase [bacterium]|jgi:geranylgeranylglycerol-phosphate geranylgeranyltransferase
MEVERTNVAQDYWELTRPFTLLAPFIGFFCLAIAGWTGQERLTFWEALQPILLGAFSAACLNAASNIINQYFDLEIDRINKPARPLPSGRISIGNALVFCGFLYLLTLITAWLVNWQFFWIVVFTALVTYAYSGPPFRTKRHWFWANFTIAIPRGCLLVVAGWTAVRDIRDMEPWIIGLVYGLFILGAASTKDYADIEGDRRGGCITLPIRFGVETSAKIITPFFIIPFVILLIAALLGVFEANSVIMASLAVILMLWGGYVGYLILRKPAELATEANHVSWKHMYLIMVLGQLGIAGAYLLH